MGITSTVETIDRHLAQKYLSKSRGNRKESKNRIEQYAQSIINKKWVLNGEPIIFDDDGKLLDGHHRLLAVICAYETFNKEVTIDSLVTSGIKKENFSTINIGKSRTGADWLSINNENNCTLLGATLNWVNRYKKEKMNDLGFCLSNPEVIPFLNKHPGIRESVHFVGCMEKMGFKTGLCAALHYLFGMANAEKCQDFFNKIETGANLSQNDPTLLIRDKIYNRTKNRIKMVEMAALCIKAWNAFTDNRSLNSLRWRNVGDKPELFPYINGLAPEQIK